MCVCEQKLYQEKRVHSLCLCQDEPKPSRHHASAAEQWSRANRRASDRSIDKQIDETTNKLEARGQKRGYSSKMYPLVIQCLFRLRRE